MLKMFQTTVAVFPTALVYFLTLFHLTLASPLVEKRQTDYHWVDTWTSMPQLVEPDNLPPSPFVKASTQDPFSTTESSLENFKQRLQ